MLGALDTKKHIIHHQDPTFAQARNIKVRMFLKKFRILKPKSTCIFGGSTIMYTKSLIAITLRKASCRIINRRVAKMSVKRAPSFITDSCLSNKKEMRKEKKNFRFRV